METITGVVVFVSKIHTQTNADDPTAIEIVAKDSIYCTVTDIRRNNEAVG